MARKIGSVAAPALVHDADNVAGDAVSELEELIGAREFVLIGRRRIEVHELTLREVGPIAREVDPLYSAWFTSDAMITTVIAEHFNEAVTLAAAACRGELERPEIEDLPAGRQVALLVAAVKANADFFVQSARLRDTVVELVGRMADGDGPTLSASSPSTAT